MHPRLLLLTLFLAGCGAPGRDARRGSGADSVLAEGLRTVPAVAYRVPRAGGQIAVYTLPGLDTTPWGGGRTGGARGAVATDLIGRRLLYHDSSGAVAAFDLVALRERQAARRASLTALGPDGSLLAVDSSGGVSESQPWGLRTWSGTLGRGVRDVFAGPGQQLIAVRGGRGDSLLFVSRESGVTAAAAAPESAARAAARDGDAVAFATAEGVTVFEEREMDEPWSVRLAGGPVAVTFSPSGHRLYVALRDRRELAVIDRFNRTERGAVSLPGPARALRFDPWGRVLLVQPADDSTLTWVVGMARGGLIGRLATRWASDLPTVSESGVLLARQSGAVVARDAVTLDSLGAVPGGAGDTWFAGRWVARSATAATRSEVAERRGASAPPPERGSAARPEPGAPAAAPAATPAFYAQLMATRDEAAAREAARALGRGVLVVAPRPNDDMWRVMAGPFRSREAADSAGRAIGRAYWVVDRSREPKP